MTELDVFFQLKLSVLETYRKQHPYFTGSWKTFSSQDIFNLIDSIQLNTKQSVSEKWIYTHLKPEQNEKLPRKDMLDILSQYVGLSGWDEFKFQYKGTAISEETEEAIISKTGNSKAFYVIGICLILILAALFLKNVFVPEKKTIELKDTFTKEKIATDEVKAFVVNDSVEKAIPIKNGILEVGVKDIVVLKSPFYEGKQITVSSNSEPQIIELKPDDYGMMLKAFMQSDIKDWEIRKAQLEMILSDNLEVMVMLKDNLGVEYFDKKEFTQQLVVPTPSLKQLKIVVLEKDKENKISLIRLIQK
ncbi:hypothetical protein [Flavobacterium suncheonense]|uniref:hypothetical protein n=1 Tax=Flavobacterium suncheonense TaxID=350894 RepID=UPI003FA3737C